MVSVGVGLTVKAGIFGLQPWLASPSSTDRKKGKTLCLMEHWPWLLLLLSQTCQTCTVSTSWNVSPPESRKRDETMGTLPKSYSTCIGQRHNHLATPCLLAPLTLRRSIDTGSLNPVINTSKGAKYNKRCIKPTESPTLDAELTGWSCSKSPHNRISGVWNKLNSRCVGKLKLTYGTSAEARK